MLRNVLLKSIQERRRGLILWALGMALLTAWTVSVYPAVRDSAADLSRYIEEMPEAMRTFFMAEDVDFASPEGFLSVEIFSMVVPVLLLVFGIGFGSAALAGEEQRGTLDLLLANPISRRRVLVEKAGAMLLATASLGLVLWLTLAVATRLAGMDISLGSLAAATTSGVLLGWSFGALALAFGSLTGSRAFAIGVASAVAVAAYLLNGLAQVVDGLAPYRKVSPFYYYFGSDPLANGLNWAHAGALLVLTAVALGIAVVAFERRDLAT